MSSMRKEELVVEEDEDLKMVEVGDEDEDIWRPRLNIGVDFCSILVEMQSLFFHLKVDHFAFLPVRYTLFKQIHFF